MCVADPSCCRFCDAEVEDNGAFGSPESCESVVAIGAARRGAEAPAVACWRIYDAEIEFNDMFARFDPFASVVGFGGTMKDAGGVAEAVVNA